MILLFIFLQIIYSLWKNSCI